MENRSLTVLKSTKDFALIKAKGKRAFLDKKILVCYLNNNLENHRVGWTISKAVGNAVLRNKLKRYSREFFREDDHQKSDKKVDVNLVFLKSGSAQFRNMNYNEFKKLLQPSWIKITK